MNSYRVDRQKWQVLSIFEQMGNIYAEVGRTFAAKRRNDSEAALAAAVRSFDLFDATCESLAEHRSPKFTDVLMVQGSQAAVQWHLSYVLENIKHVWAGVYVIRLRKGICSYFYQVGEAMS
jgi:hypothetical protein